MSDDKDKASPATTSYAYDRMAPSWAVVDTLLGGTESMRAAGENYTPRHSEETDEGYRARLQSAVLLNMVEQTLDTLSGKPFSEPMKPSEDVPALVTDTILDDVDLQGNNIDVFAHQLFRQGMAKALVHVLVDMPRPEPVAAVEGAAPAPRTLADDREQGVRPYWVMIKPEALLYARASIINGTEVLQHVRILEIFYEEDGFAEVEKVRIRVLEPGLVKIYAPVEKKTSGQKEEWSLEDEWATGLDYIPMVTYYADRTNFMEGKPPLLDLAWLNVAHWQSTSDQRNILKVARFPILACEEANSEDSETIVIGPNKVLFGPGKFKYVEHTGSAIEAGRKDLEDLERVMSGYGAEFLKKRPGGGTATARALDSAEASSDLSAMSVVFEDTMAQILAFTSDALNLGTDGGEVEVVKDYQIEELDPQALEFIKYMREKNDLSRKAVIAVAITHGFLPEDFDEEEDWEQVVKEVTQRSELLGEAFGDLDPGAEEEEEEDGGKKEDLDDDEKKPGSGSGEG